MQTEELSKTMNEIWKDKYVIPLYQRNFAWGCEQISQLLQDIYDSYRSHEANYYVGSLVVMQRQDGAYEVIDGQQRLTVMSLISKILDIPGEHHLSYDSRPEVASFLNGLPKNNWNDYIAKCGTESNGRITRLLDAINHIVTSHILVNESGDDFTTIGEMLTNGEAKPFAEYLKSHVVLVRTQLPSDTDVAAYFEIMNNRGEQLQEHEIVKALMLVSLNESQKNVFSVVWDACSQMNVPIQRSLLEFGRTYNLFGPNYDSLNIEIIDNYDYDVGTVRNNMTIDAILKDGGDHLTPSTNEDVEEKYESIIDFPNFLMHVFKIEIGQKKEADIPLNADKLLAVYEENGRDSESKIDPMSFIKTLLKCRVLFDRFVIKNQANDDDVENVKWILQRPYRYGDNALKFRNTFGVDDKEIDDAEVDNDLQKRVIKQQSMLQVTYSNRKYKNWLFVFLNLLNNKDIENIGGEEIKAFFDKSMSKICEELIKNDRKGNEKKFDIFNAGTYTPHFLLNFIDYLYWVEHISQETHNVENIKYVEDFDFKYYNSVEHHLPQSYTNFKEGETDDKKRIIDNIGNLCLISGSANSSLNDKGPVEKAKFRPGLMPKRRIMYSITSSERRWGIDEIKKHGNDIEYLLSHHKEILGIV